jgi:hypothetical protein
VLSVLSVLTALSVLLAVFLWVLLLLGVDLHVR